MYVHKNIRHVLVVFFMIVVCTAEYDNFEQTDEKRSCERQVWECTEFVTDISDEIRRFVNILLSRADFRNRQGGDLLFHDSIGLKLTEPELETLEKFGRGISTLRTAAPVLKKMIKTTEIDGSMSLELIDFIVKNNIGIIFMSIVYLCLLSRNITRDNEIWISMLLFGILFFIIAAFVSLTENKAIIGNTPQDKSIGEFERKLDWVIGQAFDQTFDIVFTLIKILINYSMRLALWIMQFIVPEEKLKMMAVMCCCAAYALYESYRELIRWRNTHIEIVNEPLIFSHASNKTKRKKKKRY